MDLFQLIYHNPILDNPVDNHWKVCNALNNTPSIEVVMKSTTTVDKLINLNGGGLPEADASPPKNLPRRSQPVNSGNLDNNPFKEGPKIQDSDKNQEIFYGPEIQDPTAEKEKLLKEIIFNENAESFPDDSNDWSNHDSSSSSSGESSDSEPETDWSDFENKMKQSGQTLSDVEEMTTSDSDAEQEYQNTLEPYGYEISDSEDISDTEFDYERDRELFPSADSPGSQSAKNDEYLNLLDYETKLKKFRNKFRF